MSRGFATSPNTFQHQVVVIGVSAGGMSALENIFSKLDRNCCLAFIVVQHVSPDSDDFLAKYLNEKSKLIVKQADEKETIQEGRVYLAPPNYHLLIEEDKTFSLTVDKKINHARPSIDLMFETAAYVYESSLIGIILTGANSDGSQGMKSIKTAGGLTLVQDPETAEMPMMPTEAIRAVEVDHVLSLGEIAVFLNRYCKHGSEGCK